MSDRRTLDIYAERASDYADRFDAKRPGTHLAGFIGAVPRGGRVLDLGCGTGRSAAFMYEAGLTVDAWDASPQMAAVGKARHGVEITVATFDDLDASSFYDGVFANFSLLHAPKREMPEILGRIGRALKPNGLFHIGLKTGTGEARDSLGRFYAYYQPDEIEELLTEAGFDIETRDTGAETGLDGKVAPWVILTARKRT